MYPHKKNSFTKRENSILPPASDKSKDFLAAAEGGLYNAAFLDSRLRGNNREKRE
jgi:hypothetical protein